MDEKVFQRMIGGSWHRKVVGLFEPVISPGLLGKNENGSLAVSLVNGRLTPVVWKLVKPVCSPPPTDP